LYALASNDTSHADNADLFGRLTEHGNLPVRAVVKNLATDRTPSTLAHLQGMREDMEELHRLRVLVDDVTVYHYMGGRVVDFGCSGQLCPGKGTWR
jgi:hypothetical protein